MENTDIRTLDELGRLSVPLKLRKQLGWDTESKLAVTIDAENRTLQLALVSQAD